MKEMKQIYKEFLKKHFSQSSQVYYERAERWLKSLPNNPDKITADYVIDYIDGYAPATQKQYVIFFRKLFKHLGRFDEIEDIRGKKIKPTIAVDDLYTGSVEKVTS